MDERELQEAARNHLWLHFTRMAGVAGGEVPIIVRGDGCYLVVQGHEGAATPVRQCGHYALVG